MLSSKEGRVAVKPRQFHARRVPALATLIAIACALAACGPASSPPSGGASSARAAGFPVTVSAGGVTTRVPARPGAIMSLSPTGTEMLYAIGAGRQVTAVDSDSDYPPQAPHTKLSGLQPNLEAIAARKPDLVITSYNPARLARQLARFGIPVLALPAAASLPGVYQQFTELGQATGHPAQAAREVAAVRGQLARIRASVPHHRPPVSYYYELDQTYYSVTSGTFVGRLLGMLGMRSIADKASGAAAAGGYPQLSSEYILRANPGYIILADTVCCHQDRATVAKRPGWSSLAAVKDRHVIGLNDDIASRWGPRIVDLLRAVARALQQ